MNRRLFLTALASLAAATATDLSFGKWDEPKYSISFDPSAQYGQAVVFTDKTCEQDVAELLLKSARTVVPAGSLISISEPSYDVYEDCYVMYWKYSPGRGDIRI